MDRVDADMPNELDVNPANDADVAVVPNPLGLVAASFEPVEFSGLSTSIASLWLALFMPMRLALAVDALLCRRCLLGPRATVLAAAAAPGPGIFLGGAAAIGTTPLPPTATDPPLL